MGKKNQSYLFRKDLIRFEGLFQQYYPRLKRYAYHIVGDAEEAEDLVQDVFLHVWKNRNKLDGEKNISAYLFTIIRNKCLNLLKRKLVEEKYILNRIKFETEELYHISFNDSEDFLSLEEKLQSGLNDLIGKMPPQCGIAFRLRWIEGKKIREIAAEMGISTTMVDKHLAKGIEIAKNNLNSDLFLFLMLFYHTSNSYKILQS